MTVEMLMGLVIGAGVTQLLGGTLIAFWLRQAAKFYLTSQAEERRLSDKQGAASHERQVALQTRIVEVAASVAGSVFKSSTSCAPAPEPLYDTTAVAWRPLGDFELGKEAVENSLNLNTESEHNVAQKLYREWLKQAIKDEPETGEPEGPDGVTFNGPVEFSTTTGNADTFFHKTPEHTVLERKHVVGNEGINGERY
jgi:hypothetical protein